VDVENGVLIEMSSVPSSGQYPDGFSYVGVSAVKKKAVIGYYFNRRQAPS